MMLWLTNLVDTFQCHWFLLNKFWVLPMWRKCERENMKRYLPNTTGVYPSRSDRFVRWQWIVILDTVYWKDHTRLGWNYSNALHAFFFCLIPTVKEVLLLLIPTVKKALILKKARTLPGAKQLAQFELEPRSDCRARAINGQNRVHNPVCHCFRHVCPSALVRWVPSGNCCYCLWGVGRGEGMNVGGRLLVGWFINGLTSGHI